MPRPDLAAARGMLMLLPMNFAKAAIGRPSDNMKPSSSGTEHFS